MSSVLIGILAVILLICLGMLGASFFGSQFNAISARTDAMAMTQKADQLSKASHLYWTKEGYPVIARSPVGHLLEKGYLKDLPRNPYVEHGGAPFRILFSGDIYSSSYYADVILVDMGSGDDVKRVCAELNGNAGENGEVPEIAVGEGTRISAMVTSDKGCFKMHDVGIYGEAGPHNYIMYNRI